MLHDEVAQNRRHKEDDDGVGHHAEQPSHTHLHVPVGVGVGDGVVVADDGGKAEHQVLGTQRDHEGRQIVGVLQESVEQADDHGEGDAHRHADQAGQRLVISGGDHVLAEYGHEHAGQADLRTRGQVDLTADQNHGDAQRDQALDGAGTKQVHPVVQLHKGVRGDPQRDNDQNQNDLRHMVQEVVHDFFLVNSLVHWNVLPYKAYTNRLLSWNRSFPWSIPR